MSAGRRGEGGYSLVALMVVVAVMLVALTAAVPSWRYVMKDDREEELIFRGGEIADAIARYQRRNGNALPPSMEALVKGKFLRRAYKDPMTKDGRWRLIRPGEALGAGVPGAGGAGGTAGGPSSPFGGSTPQGTAATGAGSGSRPGSTGATSSAFTQPGTTLGGFQGVASTSTEKSLRVFNGRTKYSEWIFLPGQPRVVGRASGPAPGSPGGGVRPQSSPGQTISRP
jgi:type II secretory pathway pseudopilin PulG